MRTNVKDETGCFDMAGCKIRFGDLVLIKSERTNRRTIARIVKPRTDCVTGFCVKYRKNYLVWDEQNHDICYEVMKIL